MTAQPTLRPLSTRRSPSRETARQMHLPATKRTGPENAYAFVHELLGEDVHAMRVLSLANGVVGVMHAAALGIHAIGRALADAIDLDRVQILSGGVKSGDYTSFGELMRRA